MDNNNDFQPNFGNGNKESSEIITDAVIQLSEKMGYPIEQKNGQRTFGPHPDDASVSPPRGSGFGFFSCFTFIFVLLFSKFMSHRKIFRSPHSKSA